MISLVIEDYCQDCPEFDPAIGRDNKYEYTSDGQTVLEGYDRTVECSHRRRCANMANYIRKEIERKPETKNRECNEENTKTSSIALTCNYCDQYDGVYGVPGCAPCKLRNEMVLGEGIACRCFSHTINAFEGGKT